MQRAGRRIEGTEAEQPVRGTAAARRETSSAGAAVPPPLTADALRAAQGSAGNAAVTGMIARRARPAPMAEARMAEEPWHGTGPDEQPVKQPAVHGVLRSTGRPLDGPLRAEMEARLGTDFSDVRVHTDTEARRSAAEVGARAYTSGSHVVIGAGGSDKHTLAHELTHVIQQRQGAVAGTDNGSGLKISDPSDRFERAAEANAKLVMSGPAPVQREAEPPHPARSGHVAAVQRMETGTPGGESPGAQQESAVPASGRQQSQEIPDAKRVGLEIEITVDIQEISQGSKGSSSKGKGASTLKNGDLLAESEDKELGMPVIKLEVEGVDRAAADPSIEVIYGPLPRDEYMKESHQTARRKLLGAFRNVAGKSVPLVEVITAYNRSLKGEDEGRYTLNMAGKGRQVKTLQTKGVNQNMQTNISLPYAKVGAAPPPAEEPTNRGRGRGVGRGGVGRGAGRGVGPAGRGRGGPTGPASASASRVRGDFAGLFHENGRQRGMFEAARAAANTIVRGIDDTRVNGHPNVVSLLTQVLFLEAMYVLHRITRGEEKPKDKHHFYVMLKVSPQDAVMTILDEEEATGLRDWLGGAAAQQELTRGASRAFEKGGSMPRTVRVDVADLRTALDTRLRTDRQQLSKKVTENNSSLVFDQQDAPAGELRHFHPRPSNREPVTVQNGVHHVVVEERSASHPLNNPEGRPADKIRFIRDLQEE
ncbi:eCIS core domain-containing protein [Streptomyces sp. Z38]|uniref:eCIS core domain-containing protein n=1 Tax=Streptomyces sp. Z38 TaxID=2682780 RepID=UPI0018D1B9A4